ncbi:hypothetical protein VP01_55g9 [Puccinia sorghi]|uniref:C2 NT-type domain-containing protein n=1 Tax=Puccinia sorghi TaxID=27349 RepID=A0A0L6UJ15_9BASI|nr:hypothetical protein VP01_55g9 [Puccinia sorghi]
MEIQPTNSRTPTNNNQYGATDYHEIKNHSVLFRHAFHCPISINLDKQSILQPSILTILVKEEHVNQQGRRIVSRHGSINIDLSQYTPLIHFPEQNSHPQRTLSDQQPPPPPPQQNLSRIEKAKFLLRDCKTNASLKLQIQMDYLGGMPAFKIGSYAEVPMTRGLSQPDDTRSSKPQLPPTKERKENSRFHWPQVY